MTPPLSTEALDYVRDLIRQSLKVGAPGLAEPVREAVVRSIFLKIDGKVIQPLLTDKAAAEAAYQQATAEKNGWRDRAVRARAAQAAANAEAASLRAEAEAKDRARDDALKAAIRAWSAKLHIPVTRMMSRELRAEFSAALARAATAGEGRSDPPALDDRDFCECGIGQCRALTERCREDADGQPR